jgi:hypothetical protein
MASNVGLFLGPPLFVIILFIPIEEFEQELSFEAKIILATTIWMGVW